MNDIAKNLKHRLKRHIQRLNNGGVLPGREIQYVLPEKEQKNKPVIINIVLFLVTLYSTTFVGAHLGKTLPEFLISGLSYSIPLLLILLSHEFGHYFAARRFGVKATLPYFIPFPSIIGTMGAVIKMKSPIPNKRALLYIGALGPIPGFILSLAAVIYGVYFSHVEPLPEIPAGGMQIIFGDSLLLTFIVEQIHGVIPPGHDIFLSPTAFAGWVGFLVTGLNLMPIGQLDGGHILYALIGKKQVYFGWFFLCVLVVLSFWFEGWALWIVLILLLVMVAHPPVPHGPELTFREKIMGWSCMIIFVLVFVPVPAKILYESAIK
ncbi:MAG: site-2 protease family protein [bacterium]|nr:site-2 protease family protein [bacterium]